MHGAAEGWQGEACAQGPRPPPFLHPPRFPSTSCGVSAALHLSSGQPTFTRGYYDLRPIVPLPPPSRVAPQRIALPLPPATNLHQRRPAYTRPAAFCASPQISARSDSAPRAPSLAAPSHVHLPRIHQPHTHRSPHTTARSEAMEDVGTAHAAHGSLAPPVRRLALSARMPLTRQLLSGGRSARRSSARTSVRRASVRTWLSRCGRRAWPTRSELAPVCL